MKPLSRKRIRTVPGDTIDRFILPIDRIDANHGPVGSNHRPFGCQPSNVSYQPSTVSCFIDRLDANYRTFRINRRPFHVPSTVWMSTMERFVSTVDRCISTIDHLGTAVVTDRNTHLFGTSRHMYSLYGGHSICSRSDMQLRLSMRTFPTPRDALNLSIQYRAPGSLCHIPAQRVFPNVNIYTDKTYLAAQCARSP